VCCGSGSFLIVGITLACVKGNPNCKPRNQRNNILRAQIE
jgi:hypothetical protein